jgi:hypothetical protein
MFDYLLKIVIGFWNNQRIMVFVYTEPFISFSFESFQNTHCDPRKATLCSWQCRPASRFDYRARSPARLLDWRSIRNNRTLRRRASCSLPARMDCAKGARLFAHEARNGCVRQACLFNINH